MYKVLFFIFVLLLSCERNYTDNPDNELIYAVKKNDINLLKIAIAKNANLNWQDEKGRTPLHWAAYYGNTEIAKLLIFHGANPYIKDKNGLTPLDIARMNNKIKFFKEITEMVKGVKNDKSSADRH